MANRARFTFGGRRETHLGYSWWNGVAPGGFPVLIGKKNTSGRGQTIPKWVDAEVQSLLPDEIYWPDNDIVAAHALVDALLAVDVDFLLQAHEDFPEHAFGFEEAYLPWAIAKIYPHDHDLAAGSEHFFPHEKQIKTKDYLYTRPLTGPVVLDVYIARLVDGDSWGLSIFRTDRSILSKAWVDLISNNARVFEHHKGRWKGIKIDPSLIDRVLGKGALPTGT